MTENKITMTIKPAQNKVPQIDGMIALKKIQHYTYALTDQIGLGFSSHVYRGRNQHNNEPVAVKVIDLKKEDELSRQFMNDQINILETIKARNPYNLLKLFDVFKTKNNLYIITEFCEGKDVAKLLRKKKIFSEVECQSILKQLMNAYRQLYELSVVHRDLKLANVFIRKGIVKLADFGFAISSERCTEKFDYNVGSPYYMPPEALKFNKYSFKSDVWSFGVIAFEMIYGHLPWKQKIQSILYEKINNTPVEQLFEPDIQITDNYKHFILSCLQIDYDRRATPEYIINYQWPLAHDFVQGVQHDGNPVSYKPMSMIRMPSMGNQPALSSQPFAAGIIEEPSREKAKHSTYHPESFANMANLRDRSPAHKTQNRISYQSQQSDRPKPVYKEAVAKQSSNAKLIDIFQGADSPVSTIQHPPQPVTQSVPLNPHEAAQNAQKCILSQIYYCKFMSNLWDFLDESSRSQNLPDFGQIKSELITKILGKSDVLMKLRQGDNLLQIQGFNFYRSTQKWNKLKEIIHLFFLKYREKYPSDQKPDTYDHILPNLIRNLKQNIPAYYQLLQELTYFYQLKDFEKRHNITYFANNSRLELLSDRKLGKLQNVKPELYDRLSYKLSLLGL